MTKLGSTGDSLHHIETAGLSRSHTLENDTTKGQGQVSKKRKNISQEQLQSRRKRIKSFYNDKYRELFNTTVQAATWQSSGDVVNTFLPSQHGITKWSSEEKKIFFHAVARRGRDDLPGIASKIGTKNELEVLEYIKLLQAAAVEQHVSCRGRELFEVSQIPGALEVSPKCCDALERAADSLLLLQQQAEEELERNEHQDLWLLNQKVADWADHSLNKGAVNDVRKRLPAAEMLNLQNFLMLSATVFMNSKVAEENWRSYCTEKEKPSITYTAFSDFYNLVISLTIRLVQSTLFLAMSRLRASTLPKYTPRPLVRRQDVDVALKVLGIQASSQEFWAKAAKKCRLTVCDDEQNGEASKEYLDYAEMEKGLKTQQEDDAETSNEVASETNDSVSTSLPPMISPSLLPSRTDSASGNSEYASDYDPSGYSDSVASSGNTNFPSTTSDHSSMSSGNNKLSEEDLDVFAEAIDMRASHDEEKKLWNLLNLKPPKHLQPTDVKLPKPPRAIRKIGDDLDDWRDCVDYAPEWEVYGKPLPSKSFHRNRPKQRNSGIAAVSHIEDNEERRDMDDEQGGEDQKSSSSNDEDEEEEDENTNPTPQKSWLNTLNEQENRNKTQLKTTYPIDHSDEPNSSSSSSNRDSQKEAAKVLTERSSTEETAENQ